MRLKTSWTFKGRSLISFKKMRGEQQNKKKEGTAGFERGRTSAEPREQRWHLKQWRPRLLCSLVSRLALETRKQKREEKNNKRIKRKKRATEKKVERKEKEIEMSQQRWVVVVDWLAQFGSCEVLPWEGGQCVLVQAWDALWGNSLSVCEWLTDCVRGLFFTPQYF